MKEEASALRDQDVKRVETLNAQLREAVDAVKKIAGGYGFRVCGG